MLPNSELKELIEQTYQRRNDVCNGCEFNSENRKRDDKDFKTIRFDRHCTSCGCTLSAKLRSLSSDCPKEKWLSLDKEVKLSGNGKD